MSQEEFRTFIEKLAGKYHGNTYHLINKNCNHFTDDVCQSLTGKPIPSWVNRLARVGWYWYQFVCFLFYLKLQAADAFCLENLGSVFDCLLPESVQVSPVGRVPTLRQSSGQYQPKFSIALRFSISVTSKVAFHALFYQFKTMWACLIQLGL